MTCRCASIAMTEIIHTDGFDRDLKKLAKKYNSLFDDISVFEVALSTVRQIPLRDTPRISDLGAKYEKYPVYKVKAFRCRALKGKGSKSGFRIIYYDDVKSDVIHLIQMYHKSTTEMHDSVRIAEFLDGLI